MLGSVTDAIKHNRPATELLRRLILFPYLISETFITLVQEERPRALVVLAHLFGLLARFRDRWFIRDTGRREVLAIQAYLPRPWQVSRIRSTTLLSPPKTLVRG